MTSLKHESIIELFRARPRLAADLLSIAAVLDATPVTGGTVTEGDLTQLVPVEYRADLVIRLTGGVRLVVVVEAQLKPDPDKRRSWPAYIAGVHARTGCRVALLVVTLDRRTAAWARKRVNLGPSMVVQPIVIGPDLIPVVTDPVQAASTPEIAVLSAMAHGKGRSGLAIGKAALSMADGLDEATRKLYLDLVLVSLNDVVRPIMEAIMLQKWEPQSQFFRNLDAKARAEGREEGREEGLEGGERKVLLRQLRRRFGELSPEVLARVEQAGVDELELWADRVLEAGTVEAVLGG